jgi:hypothetical protein
MCKQQKFNNAAYDRNLLLMQSLLKHPEVDPTINDNQAIRCAALRGHTDVIELLLTDLRVNPSDGDNFAIVEAYNHNFPKTVQLLWSDKRIKDTLNSQKPELYEILKKQDIENKISDF